MKYVMTVDPPDSTNLHWEPCKAQSLTVAKREATRKFGIPDFDGSSLLIATTLPNGKRHLVAMRLPEGWYNLDEDTNL